MSTTGEHAWIADLYDAYATFAGDLRFWVEEASVASGPVLELMCGTGRVTLPLLRASVRVTSVDLSRPMLDRLSRKAAAEGLEADVRCADVSRLDLGERDFALAILPFGSFSELVAPGAQRAALRAVRAHLRPAGRFVCALNVPARRRAAIDGRERLLGSYPLSGPACTLRLHSTSSLEPGSTHVRALQRYELLDAAGRVLEERLLDVRYDLVEPASFARMAAEAGFRVAALWGDYARAPYDEATSPYAIFTLVA